MTNKTCSKCKESKPLSAFYKATWCSDGVRPECKICQNARSGVNQKKRRKSNPSTFRNTALNQKYGINLQVYLLMLEDQNHACAICKSKDPGKKNKYFCIDHCHKTGRIRGLLCYSCNVGLGFYRDSCELLSSAIDYLRGQL